MSVRWDKKIIKVVYSVYVVNIEDDKKKVIFSAKYAFFSFK